MKDVVTWMFLLMNKLSFIITKLISFRRSVGNLQQALVCLEKRLVVSHELGVPEAKAQAYGELGALHIALSNLEQAVLCLDHQKNIAK